MSKTNKLFPLLNADGTPFEDYTITVEGKQFVPRYQGVRITQFKAIEGAYLAVREHDEDRTGVVRPSALRRRPPTKYNPHVYGSLVAGVQVGAFASESAAKQAAKRHGYNNVSVRYNKGRHVYVTYRLKEGTWKPVLRGTKANAKMKGEA